MSEYLSTKEAAARMNISESKVQALCRDNALPGAFQEYEYSPWHIPIDAVNAWVEKEKGIEQELSSHEPHRKTAASAIQSSEEQSFTTDLEPPSTPMWRKIAAVALIASILGAIIQSTGDSMGIYDRIKQVFATATPLPVAAAKPNETLIIVATFHSTVNNTEPHVKIRRMIEQKATEFNIRELRVEIEPTIFTADDQPKALVLGKRYNASMIIWGEDTGVEVIVNYLNLKEPDFPAGEVKIIEQENVQLASPTAYSQFVTKDLPSQLTFLSLFAVGHSYYNKGKYVDALTIIEKAITSLNPEIESVEGLADAYFRLGWLYQVLEKNRSTEKAIASYTNAIQHDSHYTKAYNNRGVIYLNQGELDLAITDLTEAIKVDSNNMAAYNNRAIANAKQGNRKTALSDCETFRLLLLKESGINLGDYYCNQIIVLPILIQLTPTPTPTATLTPTSTPTPTLTKDPFSQVLVSEEEITISVFDAGVSDGDKIRLTVNGVPILADQLITGTSFDISVTLSSGENVIAITALNTGVSYPNTPALHMSHVIRGNPLQSFTLDATETATFIVTKPWIKVTAKESEAWGEVGPSSFCTSDYKVNLYAKTAMWYIQPFPDSRRNIQISGDCTWRSSTHPWHQMAAHLVKADYDPPPTILEVSCPPLAPAPNSNILAAGCFP